MYTIKEIIQPTVGSVRRKGNIGDKLYIQSGLSKVSYTLLAIF